MNATKVNQISEEDQWFRSSINVLEDEY